MLTHWHLFIWRTAYICFSNCFCFTYLHLLQIRKAETLLQCLCSSFAEQPLYVCFSLYVGCWLVQWEGQYHRNVIYIQQATQQHCVFCICTLSTACDKQEMLKKRKSKTKMENMNCTEPTVWRTDWCQAKCCEF